MTIATRIGSDLGEPEDDSGPDRKKSFPTHEGQVRVWNRARKNRMRSNIDSTCCGPDPQKSSRHRGVPRLAVTAPRPHGVAADRVSW
jgi:hypothetical protein